MSRWKHRKTPVFIGKYCFCLIFTTDCSLKSRPYFYSSFEDSSAFPLCPTSFLFFPEETSTNLENKKVYDEVFLINYIQLWTPLKMATSLYLERQDTFVNKKNKITLSELLKNESIL